LYFIFSSPSLVLLNYQLSQKLKPIKKMVDLII
jgi:hypothetical protein